MASRNITFCQNNLPDISFAAFEDMRAKGELCDLTIRVKDYAIVAHRVIVAAGIPYFRSQFTTTPAENEEIAVGDLNPAALESLIKFAYSSKVNISDENVQSLLVASEFLQLIPVRDACVEFLSEILCSNNVVQVRTLAYSLNNTNLIEISNRYMLKNFEEFSKSRDFLRLPQSAVKQIIAEDDLDASTEETVFEAVIKWVKDSPCEREEALPELLSEVRMVHLPVRYLLKHVASDSLVLASKPCCDLIEKVKNYHILPEETSLFENVKTSRRKGYGTEHVLLGICKVWTSTEISVHQCNLIDKSWKIFASHKLSVEINVWSAAAAVNEKIYVFLDEIIETFHLKSFQWQVLHPKHGSFLGSAVLSFENRIYIFSSTEKTFYDKVRCFDVEQNIWLNDDKMKTSRIYAAAVSMEKDIYVLGGVHCEQLSTVEKYNIKTGVWTETASMLFPRNNHAGACMNGKIYVCGGGDPFHPTRSAEVYDPFTDQWNSISCMKAARSNFSLIPYKDKIYAFGGRMYVDKNMDFEIYDPARDQWNSVFDVPGGFRYALLVSTAGN